MLLSLVEGILQNVGILNNLVFTQLSCNPIAECVKSRVVNSIQSYLESDSNQTPGTPTVTMIDISCDPDNV